MNFCLSLNILALFNSILLSSGQFNYTEAEFYYEKYCSLQEVAKFYSKPLLNCTRFTSLKKLNVGLQIIPISYINIGALYLNPSKEVILNRDLDLNALNSSVEYLTFSGFGGFSSSFTKQLSVRSLIIKKSKLDLYLDDKLLNPEDLCQHPEKYTQKFNSSQLVLNQCLILNLGKSNNYSNPICPAIFNNSFFEELTINLKSADSKAALMFLNLKPGSNLQLKLKILRLVDTDDEEEQTRMNLTPDLLSIDLFRSINKLVINKLNLAQIQPADLFKSFTNIKVLKLRLRNYKEFFHANSLDWMLSINQDVYANLSDLSSVKNLAVDSHSLFRFELNVNNVHFYDFPDKDFCNFCIYPHERMIATKISTRNVTLNATCTLIWLTLYNGIFNDAFSESSLTEYLSRNETELKMTIQNCKFDQLILGCSSPNSTRPYDYEEIAKNYTIFLSQLVGFEKSSALLTKSVNIYVLMIIIFLVLNSNSM
jgi:hypothetical protein